MSGIFAFQHSRFDPIDTSRDYALTCLLGTFPQTVWAFHKASASDESAFALTFQYLVKRTPLPTLSLNNTMKSLVRYDRPMCCRSPYRSGTFSRLYVCPADLCARVRNRLATQDGCICECMFAQVSQCKVLIKRPFHLPTRFECFDSTRADNINIPHFLHKR